LVQRLAAWLTSTLMSTCPLTPAAVAVTLACPSRRAVSAPVAATATMLVSLLVQVIDTP
jgi:hypothetical protein